MKNIQKFDKNSTQALKFVGKHLNKIEDPILLVLKSHLLIENFLNCYIENLFPNPQALKNTKLTFSQLCNLVKATNPFPFVDFHWEFLKRLNKIRNHISHEIENPNLNDDLEELKNFAIKSNRIDVEDFSEKEKLKMIIIIFCGLIYNLETSEKNAA